MKVKSLYIENYKIFQKLRLDFTDNEGQILDTIVFAGDNGCGKTTILNLLYTILTPREIRDPLCDYLQVCLLFTDRQKKLILELLQKYNQECINQFSLQVDSLLHKFGQESEVELEYIINQKNDFLIFNAIEKFSEISNQNGFRLLYTNKEIDDRLNEPNFQAIIRKGIQNFHREQPSTHGQDSLIENTFAMYPHLHEILQENIFFKSINNTRIEMEDLSSGEKQIIYRFYYLENSGLENGIIIVDEPENSLHPKWQQKIIQLYSNLNKPNQVILATHSPHIISALPPESLFILAFHSKNKLIEAINLGKKNKHSRGLEPNRVLLEIMGTPLRAPDIQHKIDTLLGYIKSEQMETDKAQKLKAHLTRTLGSRDPFIMRLEHQLRFQKPRKKK